MSNDLFDLKKLYFAREDTFSTDPSPTGVGYSFVHAQDISFTPAQDHIARPLQNASLTKIPGVVGAKGGTLTFKVEARGTGTAYGNATAAGYGEYGEILKGVLGAVHFGTGSIVESAADASTVTVDAVKGTTYNIGDCIQIESQRRRVKNRQGGVLTVSRAFSATPTSGSVVYAAANYTPADSGHLTFSFVFFQGQQQWSLTGCRGTVAFEGGTAKGRGLFSFTFQVDDWRECNKASLPSPNVFLYPRGPVVLGSTLQSGVSALPVAEFSFDVANEIAETPSTAGTQGRSNYQVVDRNAVGSFKPLWATSQLAEFVSGSVTEVVFDVGSVESNAYMISVCSASFTAIPAAEAINKQVFMNKVFQVNQANSGSVPDFGIHLF